MVALYLLRIAFVGYVQLKRDIKAIQYIFTFPFNGPERKNPAEF